MKRYIALLFVSFFGVTLFAQETIVKITDYDYSSSFRDKRCGEFIRLTAFYEGGGSEIFEYLNEDETRQYSGKTYRLNGILQRIELYAYARDARDEGFTYSCSKGKEVAKPQNRMFSLNPCTINDFYIKHSNGNDVSQKISFKVEAIAVPDISRTAVSNIAGYEDPINMEASNGFLNSVYNWQYGFQTGEEQYVCGIFPIKYCTRPTFDWLDLNIPNISSTSFKLNDFFLEDIIGKSIFFRIQSCNQESSNIIEYQVRKSAPHLISSASEDVRCFGTEDGSIRLTFDRPLEAGDNFNIAIVDLSKIEETDAITGTIIFETVKTYNDISLDGSNSVVLEGLHASVPSYGFRIDIIGGYNGTPYYSDGLDHTLIFEIGQKDPVAFVGEPNDNANKSNVWCHNGSDGTITLEAMGGVEAFEYLIRIKGETWDETGWTSFSTQFKHTITGLAANTYEIQIRDANGCEARFQGNRNEEIIIKEVMITEPSAPLAIELSLINEPRAFGFKDGRISARIFGGTSIDGTYTFEWKNELGEVLTSTITTILPDDQGFKVELHSVGKGVYKLSAWDANFNSATDTVGCLFVDQEFHLGQPKPLEVTIEVLNSISCHIENEYNDGQDFNAPFDIPDQFQDGALVAHVKGGVPFDDTVANAGECRANFMPYCYRWKKKVEGTWQDIAVNDSIISNQSVGTYALNIEDRNGIVLAAYESFTKADGSREYRVITEIDSTIFLSQPDKLEIVFSNTEVTCSNGNDAEATALVTGGTAPYFYEWSTGATTPTIENLTSKTYLVFVTDAKGCQIEGRVVIAQPNGLEINPMSIVGPTCFDGNDGEIEVIVSGGNAPYTYLWSTGSTAAQINGLTSGLYTLEVTDNKGCKAFYEVDLEDPEPIKLDLEKIYALCGDQSLTLDIGIDDPGAIYSWYGDNGFTSSESLVNITQAGNYYVTIISSLGCVGEEDIRVEVYDTPIDAHFLITTQAYTNQEVILVNISNPIGETVVWEVPEGVKIITESKTELILKMKQEGPYDINMRSYQGNCYQDYKKTILIEPAIETPGAYPFSKDFIEEFIIYPNPNSGIFKAKITLAEDANIVVKIMSLLAGATLHERSEKNSKEFLLDFNVSMPSGMYLVLLETPKGTAIRKVVIE